MVTRADPRDRQQTPDPICPVCLQVIAPGDFVSGRRDDLMHEHCDYVNRRPERPKAK